MYETQSYRELPWFSAKPDAELVQSVRSKFFHPGSRLLDIGCGAGTNLIYLAKQGFDVFGVDVSSKAIEAANRRASRQGLTVHAEIGDALRLPFPSKRFDGANDRGCFHTLPIHRRKDYAAELARVLRPGAGFQITWVGREQTTAFGPPHRPSVEEVSAAFESRFIFEKVQFYPSRFNHEFAGYVGWLRRRTRPQPRRR